MWRVIVTFIAAAVIIYLSYVCSKYIGKGMSRGSSSRYMRLVDQITLGQDRHMAIIQVGERYMLLGITAGQINVLTELKEDELFPLSPESGNSEERLPDFKALMEKFGNFNKKGR